LTVIANKGKQKNTKKHFYISMCSTKTMNMLVLTYFINTILLLLQSLYDPLSGTIRVSRNQKDKPFWILLKQRWRSGSGISWTICKLFALRSRR